MPDDVSVSVDRTPAPVGDAPHVVIVGAGFGGLAAAKALAKSKVRVTVVDKRNYHLFVPLLYQVATAALSPADIAAPIRHVLWNYPNVDTVLGEVTGVDAAARRVQLAEGGFLPYDALILATGSMYNYFGHDEWAEHAIALKTIDNARMIRARLLRSFEQAEIETDPDKRRALLTIVIIGGGPTGVEMAGAVAELARFTLARDFRRIDPRWARVILIEAGPRILANFPGDLPKYATRALAEMGVDLRLSTRVTAIEPGVVVTGEERIEAATIVWGAGIKATPSAAWLGVEPDRLGRIVVARDLSVPGAPGVYAVGDVAGLETRRGPLPALAQVAKQQGAHLGRGLRALHRRPDPRLRPFRYRSRGDTAIIGRSAAVFVIGPWRLKKTVAWLLWAVVHVYLLIGFERRLSVSSQWVWRFVTRQRGVRLID